MSKQNEPVVNVNELSRIAQGAVIKGEMSSSTDIRVDGCVDGILHTDGRVVVGESARLSGKLLCTNVDFWGSMTGDVFVKDILTIKKTCTINGNISARKLQVELGARINGTCHMLTEKEYEQAVAEYVKSVTPKSAAPAPAAAPAHNPEPAAKAV